MSEHLPRDVETTKFVSFLNLNNGKVMDSEIPVQTALSYDVVRQPYAARMVLTVVDKSGAPHPDTKPVTWQLGYETMREALDVEDIHGDGNVVFFYDTDAPTVDEINVALLTDAGPPAVLSMPYKKVSDFIYNTNPIHDDWASFYAQEHIATLPPNSPDFQEVWLEPRD